MGAARVVPPFLEELIVSGAGEDGTQERGEIPQLSHEVVPKDVAAEAPLETPDGHIV